MFVEANSFRQGSRGVGDIRRIVIHTAEITETRDAAEKIAAFFANPTTKVSAHAVIDNDTVVECVRDEDVAFHALGDNDQTLGYELSGFAGQTKAQWADAYSSAMVERAARYCAVKVKKYGVAMRWLTETQERARLSGFVTHRVVSAVFGEGIRSDPGAFFPYDLFMERVKFHVARLERVVFVIRDTASDSAKLVTSAPAQVGAEEDDRLKVFLANNTQLLTKQLKQDGRVVIDREKA